MMPSSAKQNNSTRAVGWRAVIYFTPQILSKERIAAGVVARLTTGECHARVALSRDKIKHAFGFLGEEIYTVAEHLCQSLLEHVATGAEFKNWIAPFDGAGIDKLAKIEAKNMDELLEGSLRKNSFFHTLLEQYDLPKKSQSDSIIQQIKQVISRSRDTENLKDRFFGQIEIEENARPLKVDFLGAQFACYVLKLTDNNKEAVIDTSVSRAHGKLFELQSVRQHFAMNDKPPAFGVEKPENFQLLIVGKNSSPLQKSAINQIELLADRATLITKVMNDAVFAAKHIVNEERRRA